MRQILASFHKEWLLLWRDKVGLIFLFILPMCLVLFITLTESENPDKPRLIKVLLLNQDNSEVMNTVENEIKKIEGFAVKDINKKEDDSLDNAKQQVSDGNYQVLIIIPKGAGASFLKNMKNIQGGKASSLLSKVSIDILVDPTIPKNLKDQIGVAIQFLFKEVENKMLQQTMGQITQRKIADNPPDPIEVKVDALRLKGQAVPNGVQQNVPAWALFGMFFIITPLSGVLVKERTLGVMNRLHISPASFTNLILGKILTFVLLNLIQLVLMLGVGVFILPLFGLPALNVLDHLGYIILIGICASLAATGFGMLVGSFVKTPEQANVIGPFIIVIAAAVGGIFIPVYLLPEGMQKISQFSPMQWAHQAFLDVFIRNAGIEQLWPNLTKLLALFVITTWLALIKISHRVN